MSTTSVRPWPFEDDGDGTQKGAYLALKQAIWGLDTRAAAARRRGQDERAEAFDAAARLLAEMANDCTLGGLDL